MKRYLCGILLISFLCSPFAFAADPTAAEMCQARAASAYKIAMLRDQGVPYESIVDQAKKGLENKDVMIQIAVFTYVRLEGGALYGSKTTPDQARMNVLTRCQAGW